MTPLGTYIEGAADASAMLAREIDAARRAERDLVRRAKDCRARREAMSSAMFAKRAAADELARIPLIGFLFGRRKRAEADDLITGMKAVEREFSVIARDGKRVRGEIAEMEVLAPALKDAVSAARTLGFLPPPLDARAETAGNRAILLRRKVSPARRDVIDMAGEITAISAQWRAARAAADRSMAKATRPVPSTRNRVYLPIPVSMRHAAARLGAIYDKSAPPGSRMYVPLGENLAPFERMLPLSFRARPPKLTFPPIRANAAGQALWGMFDQHTWDHIRSAAYERTGRRCMLCGKVSGGLKARLFPERAGRVGQVECHEVWDWKVPDPASGVGIQKLKALLVVCFECHAVFHEGYVTSAARKVGLEDEVGDFIEAKRLALTRMDAQELRDSLDRTEGEWRAHAGIKEWIVDLSHLAAQDFMNHAEPVLLERNAAGVPPERIAGIGFVTDSGRNFEARPAAEVYAALISDRTVGEGFRRNSGG